MEDHLAQGVDIGALVDADRGSISAQIYSDEAIYQLELEKIFAKTWLFLAHESAIPQAGDYVAAYMAEDPIVVVRQRDGSIEAFLNQCRHRGMKVCRADAGRAKVFTCTYHGWTYDLAGNLVSVPREDRAYRGELDKSEFGVKRVPRLHNYRGLIFGNWDESAESFEDYLGDMRWYLDSLVDRCARTEIVGGVTRWVINCNWKFASEQFASDMYHAEMTHLSIIMATQPEDGSLNPNATDFNAPGLQFSDPHGHGTGFFLEESPDFATYGPATEAYVAESRSVAIERLGEDRALKVRGHDTIFPNFSFLVGTNTMRVWHPRGPNAMEVWTWTLADADAPDEVKAGWRIGAMHTFGPAGTFEQDDGDNWIEIQKVLRGHMARQTRLNVSMGLGQTHQVEGFPGQTTDVYSEQAARGFYRYWAQLMSADTQEPGGEDAVR